MKKEKTHVSFQYGYACGSYDIEQDRHIIRVNGRQHNTHDEREATEIYNTLKDYPIMCQFL